MFACVDCANPHTLRNGDKMKLGDVADFIRNGVTISQNKDKNGLPITRIETIADRTINLDKCGYAGLRENDYSEYALQKGDILISHINSEKHLGKCAYFDLDDKVIHGMNLLCFRNKKDISDSKYLFHFLSSSAFLKQIPKITKKSVNQASFSISQFRDLDVYLPDLSTQTQIAKILDKSTALIAKRKAQIAELDTLVQSVFLEMFGDPTSLNSKKEKLGNIFEIKSGSTPSRKEKQYWNNGNILWVKTNEVINEKIYSSEEQITQEGFDNSSVVLFPENTILIAMYGQGKTRGRTGMLSVPATTNQACAGLVPNNIDNMYFMWFQLQLCYEALRELGRGGNQPNLNVGLIKNFPVLRPKINLQTQFAQIVEKIQTQKSQLQQSLAELEMQYQALMQRAFRGELV